MVNIPISPHQSCGLGQIPALGVGVDLIGCSTARAAVCVSVHFGEEEGTLALPVFSVHGAGDDAGDVGGGATITNTSELATISSREGIDNLGSG